MAAHSQFRRAGEVEQVADCKSAIQQIENLRYDNVVKTGMRRNRF